ILSSFERTSTPEVPADAGTSARAPQPPAPAPHARPRDGQAAHSADVDAADHVPGGYHDPVDDQAGLQPVPVIEVGTERFTLNADRVSVGRSAQADVTVEDMGVSREHLEIRRQGDHFLAVDLGSTNGSYVDGQRIQGRAQLVDGSVITVGRTRLTFRLMLPRERR
ncbi:FHA domain-containing protein, partial [Kocuria sp.]|uniref:FHA domain-containing protein n=1 Tax=Kocuria sp. TaxID=1871328 RepID=UPI0028A8AFE5